MRHFFILFFLYILTLGTSAYADDTGCVRNNCLGTCITSAEALHKIIPMICRAEYSCYQDVECVKKDDGSCGWTDSQQLKDCITLKTKGAQPSLPSAAPSANHQ